MPIDTRNSKILAAARAAIKAGDLPKAQNYLLMAEGEEAEKLLDRVNKAIAARGSGKAKHESVAQVTSEAVAAGIKQAEKEKEVAKGKAMGYGCLILLIPLLLCCGWAMYLGSPKPAENVARMCENIRRAGFKCDPQEVMQQYPNEVAYCQKTYGNYVHREELRFTWQNCMRSQGIEFVVNN